MPKRTPRTDRTAPSKKKDTHQQQARRNAAAPRPTEGGRGKRRLLPLNPRKGRRSKRQRRDLMHHLLRGAAYSTGAGTIGLLFWWIRLQML
ncbi:hypothetical protein ACWDY7_33190 [Streptomyces calvus]|uniref:Uncharacterized protein n=1 Tax=Streptomyces calvus TaxID=67282 RepID=A0AA40VL09_9ACTN|nr:hypothetical protein [Streptomyces calvus]MBA8948275.1 hypothetical protein [Streptomyces calvus]GGP84601.1 hypothetical protein GCM10010247_67400 [Streptomyces calvus]